MRKLTAADAARRAANETGCVSNRAESAIAKLAASEAKKRFNDKTGGRGVEKQALTAKLDAVIISKPQPSLQADAADKDNALQQASADEITRLKARLADAEAKKPRLSTLQKSLCSRLTLSAYRWARKCCSSYLPGHLRA
jgi:hypothetical protein